MHGRRYLNRLANRKMASGLGHPGRIPRSKTETPWARRRSATFPPDTKVTTVDAILSGWKRVTVLYRCIWAPPTLRLVIRWTICRGASLLTTAALKTDLRVNPRQLFPKLE